MLNSATPLVFLASVLYVSQPVAALPRPAGSAVLYGRRTQGQLEANKILSANGMKIFNFESLASSRR